MKVYHGKYYDELINSVKHFMSDDEAIPLFEVVSKIYYDGYVAGATNLTSKKQELIEAKCCGYCYYFKASKCILKPNINVTNIMVCDDFLKSVI